MFPHDLKTRDPGANWWAVWFRRALWLGIIQDFVMGLPAVFFPKETLRFLGQPPATEPVFASFAAVALLVLGAMYIPAAIHPYRHPVVAGMSVFARPPGIIFFLWIYPGVYPIFGVVDSVLTILQAPLFFLAFFAPPLVRIERSPSITADAKAQSPLGYTGTSFESLRAVVWSDPYAEYPYHFALGPLRPIRFFNDSSRNLIDRRDLIPYFDKLIHANGIALAGVWEITEPSSYTGYFATGSRGLVIARASVAGLTVGPGTPRAFGIAGKIFPTMQPDEHVYPANFVTVSHLSGSWARHIIDIVMTNAPSIGLDPFPNFVNRVIFRLVDTRPGYRQLHPISTLCVPLGAPIATPDLMMLKVAPDTPRILARDFRDELRVAKYPDGKLVYQIFVRDFNERAWKQLGTLTFTSDVVSESSDKRLHFWIPRDIPAGQIPGHMAIPAK